MIEPQIDLLDVYVLTQQEHIALAHSYLFSTYDLSRNSKKPFCFKQKIKV